MNSVKISIWPSGQVVVPQSVRYGGAILTEFQDRSKSKTTNIITDINIIMRMNRVNISGTSQGDGNPDISKYVRELTPIILSFEFYSAYGSASIKKKCGLDMKKKLIKFGEEGDSAHPLQPPGKFACIQSP